jgi:hypothetical protein
VTASAPVASIPTCTAAAIAPTRSIYCHDLGKYVPPDIVECNQFAAATTLSLRQMRQIALPVDPRPGINDGSYR